MKKVKLNSFFTTTFVVHHFSEWVHQTFRNFSHIISTRYSTHAAPAPNGGLPYAGNATDGACTTTGAEAPRGTAAEGGDGSDQDPKPDVGKPKTDLNRSLVKAVGESHNLFFFCVEFFCILAEMKYRCGVSIVQQKSP